MKSLINKIKKYYMHKNVDQFLQTIDFDGHTLTTEDGTFLWSELTRISALARDRLTVHDIYYHFEFGEHSTTVFEEDKNIHFLMKTVRELQGFKSDLHADIFRAKIMHGDYVIYENS